MEKENVKTPLFYKTSFYVSIYALVCAITMLLQIIAIFVTTKNFGNFNNFFLVRFLKIIVNPKTALPIETLNSLWVAISAVYIGTDRATFAWKTANLAQGKMDVGDPSKARKIIFCSGLLMLEGFVFNTIDGDFDFGLEQLASAFGTSTLLYIAGMKTIRLTSNSNGEVKKEEEKDEKN